MLTYRRHRLGTTPRLLCADAPEGSNNTRLIPPPLQLAALIASYTAYVVCLTPHTARAPLPPFVRRWWPLVSLQIEVDNLAGLAVVGYGANALRRARRHRGGRWLPCATELASPPWGEVRVSKLRVLQTVGTLACAYLVSGYTGELIDALLHWASAMGAPITHGQHRALQVLASHLLWVAMAVRVLGVRLAPFWPRPFGIGGSSGDRWFTARWRTNWLGWALGGYVLSVAGYNAVEVLNDAILPPLVEGEGESLVGQLVSPGDGDWLALALGFVGPCLTAPVFEEVLYRGFLLAALRRAFRLPLALALPAQALLFGAHHASLPALLPLTALGILWGGLYRASGNLVVPIAVHAMWNTRFFLHAMCV